MSSRPLIQDKDRTVGAGRPQMCCLRRRAGGRVGLLETPHNIPDRVQVSGRIHVVWLSRDNSRPGAE